MKWGWVTRETLCCLLHEFVIDLIRMMLGNECITDIPMENLEPGRFCTLVEIYHQYRSSQCVTLS